MPKNTMQVIRVHDYGGPEKLVLEQAPVPQVPSDQVLIHLKAAGVQPCGLEISLRLSQTFHAAHIPSDSRLGRRGDR